MPIVHGDVLRVTANFILGDGTQYQNVYHYLFDGVGTPSDATVVADIATAMDDAYDDLQPLVKNTVLNDLSSVDIVEFVTGEWTVTRNVGTFSLNMDGVGAGDMLPNMSSPFVTFKTARPKSVGRKFLFPLVEGFQVATVLAVEAVTAIVLYAAVILDDIEVDLINALHPGIVRTGIDDYLVFTAAVVTNILGTQRRRRPGVGA